MPGMMMKNKMPAAKKTAAAPMSYKMGGMVKKPMSYKKGGMVTKPMTKAKGK